MWGGGYGVLTDISDWGEGGGHNILTDLQHALVFSDSSSVIGMYQWQAKSQYLDIRVRMHLCFQTAASQQHCVCTRPSHPT